jgi:hypothetical protein
MSQKSVVPELSAFHGNISEVAQNVTAGRKPGDLVQLPIS